MFKSIFFLAILHLVGANALSPQEHQNDIARRLHKKTEVLQNGAELTLFFTHPSNTTGAEYYTNQVISLQGNASVGKGTPNVAYIYIVDTSGSTGDPDGDCGTVLQCVQQFLIAFNKEAIENGSAEVVGVIQFNDWATVETDNFQLPNSGLVEGAIWATNFSHGATSCSGALEMAADLVEDPSNTADTTVVVFAGDGRCTDGDPSEAADRLEETGAIVHTVAVGKNVNCTESYSTMDYGNYTNDMTLIPRNGGFCTSVLDPGSLTHIIDDLVGSTLLSIEMKVDGGVYTDLKDSDTTLSLPQDGAVSVGFTTTVYGLDEGLHNLCIRATGNDTLDDVVQVEDCHEILVKIEPTPVPPTLASGVSPTTSTTHKPQGDPAPQKDMPSKSDDSDKTTKGEDSGFPTAGMIVLVGSGIFLVGVLVVYFTKTATGSAKEFEGTADPDPDQDPAEAKGDYENPGIV